MFMIIIIIILIIIIIIIIYNIILVIINIILVVIIIIIYNIFIFNLRDASASKNFNNAASADFSGPKAQAAVGGRREDDGLMA